MNQKKMQEAHRINFSVMVCYTILTGMLLFAYLLEFFKGARTFTYILIFSLLNLGPYLTCLFLYRKNRTAQNLKYILTTGFSVLYAFVLLTANVPTTFVYIFLVFFMIIPYGDLKLCYISSGIAAAANIISVIIGFSTGSLTTADLAMIEIQVLSVVLSGAFSGISTLVINRVNNQRMSELNDEKDKADTLLANTLALSKGISEDIETVTERMEHLENSVNTTKDSMQDVSSGANETAEAMQSQLLQTESIVNQVDKAKEVSTLISEDVRHTEETIVVGKTNVDRLLAEVSQSEKASSLVALKMQELTENTEKMNSIVEMINSVTKQTSLLSLNASIEAARAGEAGRGFAVVASEISSLAKQTSDATINITELIDGITLSISEVFQAINQLMESNKEQNRSAETMAVNFERIENSSRSISEASNDLELVITELAKLNRAIVENINNVSAVTEEVSARASETLSGSENDALVVKEITDVIIKINEKAKQLNQ